jgi:hypothetical protein
MRFATAVLSYGLAGPMGALAGKSAHVPDPPFTWGLLKGPWFDNNLAVLEDGPDGLAMWWYTGVVADGDHARPLLDEVASVRIDGSRQPAAREPTPARLLRMGREALSRAWRFVEHRRPRRGGRSRRPR